MAVGSFVAELKPRSAVLVLYLGLWFCVLAPARCGDRPVKSVGLFDECYSCERCAPLITNNAYKALLEKHKASGSTDSKSAPHCKQCKGCTSTLTPFKFDYKFMKNKLRYHTGATSAHVFRMDSKAGKSRIVKLSGLEAKTQAEWTQNKATKKKYNRTVATRFELAVAKWVERLVNDCPVFSKVVSRPRVEKLRTVVPGRGWKLDLQEGVSHDLAAGLSLNTVSAGPGRQGETRMATDDTRKLLAKINGTQVLIAAVFDLLIMQGDRHAENVYVTSDGGINLIDNLDKSFIYPNSIFLPQTFISERSYVGNGGMKNPRTGKFASFANGHKSRHAWPRLVLDFRCHDRRPSKFPRALAACLSRLARAGPEAIEQQYGMPPRAAKLFHKRAELIRDKGLQQALKLVLRNKPQHSTTDPGGAVLYEYSTGKKPRELVHETFPLRPKCCKVTQLESLEGIECVPSISV